MVVARVHLPTGPGVYRFRDARGRTLYVGRAVNLRRRVASYWGDLGERTHLRHMVRKVARVEALLCASEHEAAWLERNALEHSLPPWNRVVGGMENAVFLEMVDSTRTPGVKVVFRPGSGLTFGPYLSGTKARLAVSALHRLYPLAYTAERLTDTEREMAGIRLVRKEDRQSLWDSVRAMLTRDHAAVQEARRRLTALRDVASAELAFERASRLQEELEGLEWITAPQRVTGLEAYDLVFHGWAAGTLVRFEVVAGRLVGWQVRPCTPTRAEPLVRATPRHWQDFAEANAHVAAALSTVLG